MPFESELYSITIYNCNCKELSTSYYSTLFLSYRVLHAQRIKLDSINIYICICIWIWFQLHLALQLASWQIPTFRILKWMSQKGRVTLFLASLIFDSGFPSLTLVEPGMMLWYEIVRPEQQATTAKPKSEPNRRSSRYIIYFRSRRRRGNNSGGLVLCIFAAKAYAQFQSCSSIFLHLQVYYETRFVSFDAFRWDGS